MSTTFGVLVDFVCRHFNYSQQELADKWGIQIELLRQWKYNRGYPRTTTELSVETIADIFLNCSQSTDSMAQDAVDSNILYFIEHIEKNGFQDFHKPITAKNFVDFLRYFLQQPINPKENKKRTQTRATGRVRKYSDTHGDKETDVIVLLLKNSREEFSWLQGLLKYKVVPELIPNVDCDIANHNHILLVGDGGAGKTSFLLNYWEKLLDSDSAGTQLLPIYVPLNRFEGNNKSFIRDYIQEQYFKSIDGLGFDKWVKSPENCDVVLLLDAINEAKNSRELGSEIEYLCSIGFRIILTSRHEMDGWKSLDDFKRVHLLPLDRKIVNNQLQIKQLIVSERLRPLLTKPMYLTLLLRIGEEAKSAGSPGELFLAHHKWVQRSFGVDKHGLVYHEIGESAFDILLPQIAASVETLKLNGKDVKTLIDQHLADEGWDYREVLGLFVDAGILIKERQTYIFSHEHYLDFYRAYGIYLEVQGGDVPQILSSQIITNTTAEFLGDLWGEYRFENEDGPSHIESWLQKHASNRRDDEAKLLCRNLVETMKISRNGFLEGCCFDNLDLSYCNFYLTSIPFASFRNSLITKDALISPGHSDLITGILATSDGRHIITGSDDGSIKMWDSITGRFIYEEYFGHSSCLALSADGTILVSGSFSGCLDIYNLSTKEWEVVRNEQSGSTCSVAITPNAKYIVSAHSDGVILLWEKTLENWSVKNRLLKKRYFFDKHTVVVLSNTIVAINFNGNICICDISLASTITELEKENAYIHMASNTNTECLYYIDGEGNLKEYNSNVNCLRTIAKIDSGEVKWISCSSKDQLLAVGIDESVYIWNTVSCKLHRKLSSHAELSQTHGVLCYPNRLAVADLRNTIHITDISSNVYINQILGHGTPPWEDKQHELISPNGQIAIRYNHQGQLIVWNIHEETMICTNIDGFIHFGKELAFNARYPFAIDSPFSPDSTKLAFSQRIASNEKFSEVAFNRERKYDHEFNVLDLINCQCLTPNLNGERVTNCTWISDSQMICITQQNSIFVLNCFVDDTGTNQCDVIFTTSLGKDFDCAEAHILPCGTGIIFCSKANEISIYDLSKKELITLKQFYRKQFCRSDPLRIRVSPQGECAIISNEEHIHILSKSEAGWVIEQMPLTFGNNNIWFWGNSIVIVSESKGEYRTFSVWCRKNGKLLYTIQSWTGPPVVSKNEKFLLYGKRDTNILIICDALTGESIHSVECYGYQDNWALSNSGDVLASINHEGVIMVKNFQMNTTVYWDPIDVRDVWGANFSESEGLDDFTKLTLSKYGANIS